MNEVEQVIPPSQTQNRTETVSRSLSIRRLLTLVSAAVAALSILGCKTSEEEATGKTATRARAIKKNPKQLRYIYDPRTDKCFALISPQYPTLGLANVPCDEKVLRQIEKDSE